MISFGPRRSLVFQLWVRLSAIMVSFALVALTLYVWLEIRDIIEEAHESAVLRSNAIATAVARIGTSGSDPSAAELAVAQTLGVAGVQFLDGNGEVAIRFGELTGLNTNSPARLENGSIAFVDGSPARLQDDGFELTKITAVDVFKGGSYGSIHVYPFPEGVGGGMRVIIAYDDIAGAARTLLFRTLALAGGMLLVAILAMWFLLDRFVARPLREYSATARRIAAGEPLRMPAIGNNELGQLGQAINGMADILRHQATIDTLTGLYNLAHLTSRLETLMEEARERKQPLTLLVCDLDNLKPVNDNYGHHVGDLLLKTVSRHLMTWAGLDYTCWRTGGDEFAAAIPGLDADQARAKAEELEQAINAAHITVPGGDMVKISLSVGMASYPEDGNTGSTLMNVADLRMYSAKWSKSRPGEPTSPAA